jgi:hypothetical protein
MRGRRAIGFVKRYTMARYPVDPLRAGGPAAGIVVLNPGDLARPAQSCCEVHPGRLLSGATGVEGWGGGDDFGSYDSTC